MLGADKMWHHLDKLGQWKGGYLPSPVTAELDISNICNHRCPECSFSYLVNKQKDLMPFDMARRVIDDMGKAGVRGVTFSGGGEPLLYGEPRLISLMKRVDYAGMDVALITNGSRMYSDEYVGFCEWVRISLDAYDEETFLRFHGRDGIEFRRVVDNVSRVAKASRVHRKQNGNSATIGVGFLTDQDSLVRHDVLHMSEFCSKIPGLDYVQFRPLVVNRIRDESLQGGMVPWGEEQLHQMADDVCEASEKYARDDFQILCSVSKYEALTKPGFDRIYPMCWAHFLQCTISANGKIYICCHMQGDDRYCLGLA
jgi:MoaA/NifB/PqqE/SkfB family radical SAM enzyme